MSCIKCDVHKYQIFYFYVATSLFISSFLFYVFVIFSFLERNLRETIGFFGMLSWWTLRRTDWALCLFFLLTGVNGSFKAFSRAFSSDADASIRFPCPNQNCGRVFNWKRNLTRHLKYECGLQPRFKCPYCDYYGKLKGNVSKHLLRRHNNRKIYVVDLFQGTA